MRLGKALVPSIGTFAASKGGVMTSPSSSEIRLTLKSFPGANLTPKRDTIFTRWKEPQAAVTTDVSSLPLPDVNRSPDGNVIADYDDGLSGLSRFHHRR